ncbi:Protein msta, isoform A [Armadillidium vulgare]|nr:Protein msta, isoform A [Armadillidium vulgare]
MLHKENSCVLCDKQAEQRCGNCFVARYCSREHQKEHWKVHKTCCFPCRIEHDKILGRHLIASRDIKAGETIISEAPVVVGPQNIYKKPMCLGCNSDSIKFKCNSCGFLLCSSDCPGSVNHQRECQLIQQGGKKANIKVVDKVNPIYQCITPLRCLWMKEKAKQKWEILMAMEDHLTERKKCERYHEVKNFIVNIILNYFNLKSFDEEEIQKICGILETNGFEVPEQNLVALYGFGYLLEHSCVPNTTRTLNSSLHLVVRAAVDIKAGHHISTSYINPFWGERIRKVHLLKFKYFECSCLRCLDPTDLNTHLSSVKCISCGKGLMTPPRDIMSNWNCEECGSSFEASEIEELLVTIYEKKEKLPQTAASFEKFLKETKRILSENHQHRTEVKLKLMQMYGKSYEKPLDKISEEEILRKRNLGNEILQIASLFSPVYLKEGIHLNRAEEILSECLQILKLETHLRDEMVMEAEGQESLKTIQHWKKKFRSKT